MAQVSDSIAATVTLKADGAIKDLSTLSRKAKETGATFNETSRTVNAAGSKTAQGVARATAAANASAGGYRQLRGSVQGAAQALGTLSVAAGVVGTATAAIFSAANAASRLNEQVNASRATFGSAATTVRDFSRTAADGLGVSASQALKASSAFGAFFAQAGFAQKASAKMSTTLVQLAGDLASFKDISTDDALAAISSGLAGESEPLRRLGVDLRIAKVDAEALALGLANTKGEITETDRVAARYTSLLRQTSTAQGDAARTANEYANTQRRFNATFEDFKASAGQAALPGLTNFTQGLVVLLNASRDTSSLKKAGVGLGDLARSAGLLASGNLPGALASLGKAGKDSGDKLQAAAKIYNDAIGKFGENSPQAAAATAALRAEVDAAERAAVRSGQAFESTARATSRLREEQNAAVGSVRAFVAAQRGSEDATIQVAQTRRGLEDAERNLSQLRARGAVDTARVADAERSVADASRSLASARRGVIDAEKELARIRQGPTGDEAGDAARAVTRANLDVERARLRAQEAGKSGRTGKPGDTGASAAERSLEVREAALGVADAIDAQAGAQRALAELNTRGAPGSREVLSAEQALADARNREADAARTQGETRDALRKAAAPDPEFARDLARANDEVTAAKLGLKRAEEELPFATLAAKSAQDEFNAAIATGKPQAEDLARVADTLAVSYDRVAFAAGLAREAVAFADQNPGTFTRGIGQGIILGLGSSTAAASTRGGALAGISRRAQGGPVSAGTPYIVGENRPELFVPDSPGRILSRVPSSSGASGGSQDTHYHFDAPMPAGLVQQIEYAGRLNDWRVGRDGRP